MLIRDEFNKLLSDGLKNILTQTYDHAPIEYNDPPLFKLNKRFHKSYSLGFKVSRELLEDDLYGGIVLKGLKKVKMKVVTSYSVDGSFGRLKFENNTFYMTGVSSALSVEHTKDLMKAFAMLSKLTKTKKVVRRKRRVKK